MNWIPFISGNRVRSSMEGKKHPSSAIRFSQSANETGFHSALGNAASAFSKSIPKCKGPQPVTSAALALTTGE
jgi:hypothetical protein